eukprot:scaffold80629_cov24-Tisochrysis_lutea.AAC.1
MKASKPPRVVGAASRAAQAPKLVARLPPHLAPCMSPQGRRRRRNRNQGARGERFEQCSLFCEKCSKC